MEQALSARDFVSSESVENVGILDVFPIFHTARLEQKIRRKPNSPSCGVAVSKKDICLLLVASRCPDFMLDPFRRRWPIQ